MRIWIIILLSMCISNVIKAQCKPDTIMIKDEWRRAETGSYMNNNGTIKIYGEKNKPLLRENKGTGKEIVLNERSETFTIRESKKRKVSECSRREYSRRGWQGVFLGFTNYMGNTQFTGLNWGRSLTLAINPFERKISLGITRLTTGLGIEYQRLMFADEYTTISTLKGGDVVPLAINEDYDVRRNTFKQFYVTLPVLFDFLPKSSPLYFAAGGIVGIRVFTKTKIVYDYEGNKHKDKERDDFSMTPLKFDVTARLGYSKYCFFANYTVTPMFQKKNGPNVHPLTLGVGWTW